MQTVSEPLDTKQGVGDGTSVMKWSVSKFNICVQHTEQGDKLVRTSPARDWGQHSQLAPLAGVAAPGTGCQNSPRKPGRHQTHMVWHMAPKGMPEETRPHRPPVSAWAFDTVGSKMRDGFLSVSPETCEMGGG